LKKKPDDVRPTRASAKALKATIKDFTVDKEKNYKTANAKRLARLVPDFIRLHHWGETAKLKTGAQSIAEHHTALVFMDRVKKASGVLKSARRLRNVLK